MLFGLSEYQENGFAAPIPVLSNDEAGALRDEVAQLRREHPSDAGHFLGTNCHLLLPSFYDLALSEKVLDAVEAVLGPNLLVWSSGFFLKDSRDEKFVSWHQDSTYWGLEPPEITTAWIALTPSVPESGCLRVVPGSHTKGQLRHVDSFAETNMLSRGQEVAVDVTEDEAHDIELQPGEMSLHHVRLVHGSEPNRAHYPRVGFAVRYIPTHVRQNGGRTFAVLARGRDDYRHFDDPPRPDAALSPDAWKTHQESLKRTNAILMATATQKTAAPGHRLKGDD